MNKKKQIERWFKDYYDSLCIYGLHIVGDIEVAEDIVMDCFVKLMEKKTIIIETSAKSYLFQMVRNACLDYLRANTLMTMAETFPEITDDSEVLVEQIERETILWKEINNLPDRCREVLLLSKRDGMKNQDIAETLQISIKTVEAQITKAYRTLRERVASIWDA